MPVGMSISVRELSAGDGERHPKVVKGDVPCSKRMSLFPVFGIRTHSLWTWYQLATNPQMRD